MQVQKHTHGAPSLVRPLECSTSEPLAQTDSTASDASTLSAPPAQTTPPLPRSTEPTAFVPLPTPLPRSSPTSSSSSTSTSSPTVDYVPLVLPASIPLSFLSSTSMTASLSLDDLAAQEEKRATQRRRRGDVDRVLQIFDQVDAHFAALQDMAGRRPSAASTSTSTSTSTTPLLPWAQE